MKSSFSALLRPLTFVCLVIVGGCDPTHNTTQINARLPSPDHAIEAVYSEDFGGGPALGVSEDVYAVWPGRFPRLIDRLFTNECVHDVKLRWETARKLEISYSVGADIHEDTQRAAPSVRRMPWLWGSSPSPQVEVHLNRTLTPATGAC